MKESAKQAATTGPAAFSARRRRRRFVCQTTAEAQTAYYTQYLFCQLIIFNSENHLHLF